MAPKAYDRLKHSIRYWLLRKLPTCQQTVEKISQSMERKLTSRERIELRLQWWICPWCQWYLERLRIIRVAARAKAVDSPVLSAISAPALSTAPRELINRELT